MSEQTKVRLNDDHEIYQYGLGVYMIPEGQATREAVKEALKLGIRHIDTAHAYQNERSVGQAVKESGIDRHDIWITTKLWPSDYGIGKTGHAIDQMLDRLDTDYIDLLLLHQQVGDYKDAWKEMEQAVEEGKVRSIGLSNFETERLEEILDIAKIKPAVNQVELHPYYQQGDLKKIMAKDNIKIESWYPLGHGDTQLLEEPLWKELGKKYLKTPAQIILRWHIQEGHIVFPKSTNPVHIKENFDIFDFSLTKEDMQRIHGLDKGQRFFQMSLPQQEQAFTTWKPED